MLEFLMDSVHRGLSLTCIWISSDLDSPDLDSDIWMFTQFGLGFRMDAGVHSFLCLFWIFTEIRFHRHVQDVQGSHCVRRGLQ